MALSIFVLFILLEQGFGQDCPSNQNVERMDTETIYCMIDGNVQNYYWYKGSVSHTQPILRLENGVKGGEKYDDDHYDITSEGNMKMINAELEHEAIYTFAVIFENGTLWRRAISVLIKVTPSPPCPIVQSCRSCDECTVTIKSKDPTTLTCYIEEVRPNVTLYWSVKGDNVTYTETASSEINDNTSDTWTISTTILFKLTCAENITFYCSVFYDHKILTIGNTTVQVRSESCNEDNTKPTSSSMKVILTCALTTLGILTLSLAVLCYTLHRCHGGRKGTLLEEVKQKTLLKELTDISSINSYCSDCQYTITYTNNGISYVNTTYEMIAALSKGEQGNRVLFVGEPGIGKSHLFRNISRKWRKGEIFKDYILIHFQLENVPKDACILEELMTFLGRSMSAAEVNGINLDLQNKKSILMLDGISNWSRLHNNATNDHKVKILSIKQLLEGDVADYSKMKIWVTSRNLDHDVKVMNTPYTKVDVVGFTESQRNLFFERFRQLKNGKNDEKEKDIQVCLERKQREEKGKDFDSEERPLNVKLSEDISSAWQTHTEGIFTDRCEDYLARSPLIARLFASLYLKNYNEDNTTLEDHLFKFITEKPKSIKTIKTLVASGNCDLLACLLEIGTNGEEEYKKYANTLHLEELLFRHMTDEYYQEAILHLLKSCKETGTEFISLEIYGDSLIVQLRELPIIHDQLVFHGVHLANTDEFKAVMSMVQKKTKTIKFHNSTVPERLSKDELQDIGNFEVLRKNESNTFERLTEDGEWKEMTTATSEV